MGTPKGILGTIQSIWARGNPLISIFETIPPQNHVFRAPFWGPGTFPGQPGPAWPPNKSWIMEDHEGTLARGRVDRGILSNCNRSPWDPNGSKSHLGSICFGACVCLSRAGSHLQMQGSPAAPTAFEPVAEDVFGIPLELAPSLPPQLALPRLPDACVTLACD